MSDLTPLDGEQQDGDTSADYSRETVSVSGKVSRRKGWIIGGIAVAAVVVLGAVALAVVMALQPTQIEQAGAACSGSKPLQALMAEIATDNPDGEPDDKALDEMFEGVVSIEDDGKTLIVNTKPEDDDILGLSSFALDCVYEELDVPSYVSELIGQTRALDGRQSAEWDNFSASWSYHPDSGANVIIVQK